MMGVSSPGSYRICCPCVPTGGYSDEVCEGAEGRRCVGKRLTNTSRSGKPVPSFDRQSTQHLAGVRHVVDTFQPSGANKKMTGLYCNADADERASDGVVHMSCVSWRLSPTRDHRRLPSADAIQQGDLHSSVLLRHETYHSAEASTEAETRSKGRRRHRRITDMAWL
jgi:hypothetical protein